MKTEFTEGICPTPSATGGSQAGLSGGFPIADVGPGGQGLHSSPYSDGICPTPGGKETPSSELGTTPSLVDVPGGPAAGSAASGIGLVDSHQSDQTFRTGK